MQDHSSQQFWLNRDLDSTSQRIAPNCVQSGNNFEILFYVQTIKKSHGIQGGVKIKAAIFVLDDIESHEGLGR